MRGRAVALAAAAAALLASAPSWADKPSPPDEPRDAYSPYERQTIDEAVARLHVEVDPHPEGKVLEGVDVETLDVFEKRDPLPGPLMRFANWFHATTRHYVIEREVLVSPGAALGPVAGRRDGAQPARAPAALARPHHPAPSAAPPASVRLLVITKDVWSLRLNSNYTFENGRLEYLFLQPSEENLIGSHQQVYGNFVLDPGHHRARRHLRPPAPRRQPRRAQRLRQRDREPRDRARRGVVRHVHLRAAALLHAREVGVGRRTWAGTTRSSAASSAESSPTSTPRQASARPSRAAPRRRAPRAAATRATT